MSTLRERDEELASIERLLAAATAGSGGLITIEGEAGAGKTALLRAAERRGEETGMRVLVAHGGEFERDFAHGVVRQLFEPALSEPGRGEELLSGKAAAAAPVFDPAAAPVGGADPLAVQHGLHNLVLALAASGPLLLLVDDAQWADLASLLTLTYVGRRLASVPAALVLTVRTGEPGGHEAPLDELRRQPSARTIEPRPLSVTATAELVAERTGGAPSTGFATACREATAGNPFLLLELLRGLELEPANGEPEDAERLAALAAAGASRAIVARLARLGEEAVAAARAVAVLEPNAHTGRIASLSGLPSDAVARSCGRLVIAGLLFDTQPVAFVHPLVRAAVLSEVPEPRRAADHARAARLLAADGAAADAVAAQLLLAEPGGDEWTVAELRAAAAAALSRGAPATAVSYLRRALREPPPREDRRAVSRELGLALLRDDEPEGIEVLRAVRAAATDPLVRAELAAELSASLAPRRPGDEGNALLEESLREIPDPSGELGLLLRGHQLMQLLNGMERVPEGLDCDPRAWPDGRTGVGRFALRQLAFLYAIGLGPTRGAEELLDRVGEDLELYAADVRTGRPGYLGTAAMALVDRGDQTAAHFAAALEASRRRGTAVGTGIFHGMRAWCALADGDLDAAWPDIEIALRLTEPTGLRSPLRIWLSAALRILLARSERGVAEDLLERVWHGGDPGPGIPGASLLVARGELRRAGGRHAEARHDFLAAAERVRWLPYANPEVLGWRTGLALAEDGLGNREEARRLAEEAVQMAEEAGGARGIGLCLRVQGAVSGGGAGIETLRRASEVLSATRARLQHAIALAELGSALRRANRREEARRPLREALDLAHRCGAAPLEERARTELRATGARPRKAVLTGVESLTPSELRVARMAAGGMTNRQIAQDLYVAPKTVETHLRHVYQKLDVMGRAELTDLRLEDA